MLKDDLGDCGSNLVPGNMGIFSILGRFECKVFFAHIVIANKWNTKNQKTKAKRTQCQLLFSLNGGGMRDDSKKSLRWGLGPPRYKFRLSVFFPPVKIPFVPVDSFSSNQRNLKCLDCNQLRRINWWPDSIVPDRNEIKSFHLTCAWDGRAPGVRVCRDHQFVKM